MPMNSSGGITVIKIVQIFDYLGFIDVNKPQNAEAFLQIFNSNFLGIVPNIFEQEKFNDDYDEVVAGS